MKRFLQAALAVLGLCSGCSKPDILTTEQFTTEYAQELRKASPGLSVEVVKDLELKVTTTDGRESTAFLDNAYHAYKLEPKSKQDVINKFVTACLEPIAGPEKPAPLDRKLIVPVIKDRPWLEETRQALLARGAKKLPEHVYEDLNPDLIILYAEDSPKNIRYFGPKDLEDAHIEKEKLRSLACENLKRLLPKIERRGSDGLFMITAGGDYEASLLLLDSIWVDMKREVRGDVVVAIPSRDLLIVTGSDDPEGIKRVRAIIDKSFDQAAYRLTRKMFVFRNGKLDEFTQ